MFHVEKENHGDLPGELQGKSFRAAAGALHPERGRLPRGTWLQAGLQIWGSPEGEGMGDSITATLRTSLCGTDGSCANVGSCPEDQEGNCLARGRQDFLTPRRAAWKWPSWGEGDPKPGGQQAGQEVGRETDIYLVTRVGLVPPSLRTLSLIDMKLFSGLRYLSDECSRMPSCGH